MSKLRASTFCWAFSSALLIQGGRSLRLPSAQLLRACRPCARTRRCASDRLRATGRTSSARIALTARRPRSWLSIRRLSCRSVPMTYNPPASSTLLVWLDLGRFRLPCAPSASSSIPSSSGAMRMSSCRQADIGAAPGHVGGDGDRAGNAGLAMMIGFCFVVARVQNLVRDLRLERFGDLLRLFDARRCRPDTGWPRAASSTRSIERVRSFRRGAVDLVVCVLADHRLVGRHSTTSS